MQTEYEREREELRRKVRLFHAYENLKHNVNFRVLIEEGFCREEVINLNRMASQEMTAEGKIAISNKAQAGPVLEAYLTRVLNDGEDAREKIPELDAIIEEQANNAEE